MNTSQDEKNYSLSSAGTEGGEIILSISGTVNLRNVEALFSEIDSIIEKKRSSSIRVDLSDLDYLDSAGALVLLRLRTRNVPVSFRNMSEKTIGIMDLIDPEVFKVKELPTDAKSPGLIRKVGGTSIELAHDFYRIMRFLGELITSTIYSITHPRWVQWHRMFFYVERAGVEGLPIVGLIGFLMGFVIALMAAAQLGQIGGEIYVPSATAIGMVKQFGPMITAILVAGRSGAAFAAEIGTMVVNEEVDALTMMGFDRMRFLVIPKVGATIIAVPLLTMYANTAGIAGGLVVALTMTDISATSFLHQIPTGITAFDLFVSLAKSALFAALIAGIGCQKGFEVRGGAESVGRYTTSAVVSAIFLILVSDTAIGLMLKYMKAA